MKVVLYQIIYYLCWRWTALCLLFKKASSRTLPPKLLIVPCDPWTVTGSRGDEAMIAALVQDFRARFPQGEVILVSALGAKPECIRTGVLADARIEPVWRGRVPFLNIIRCVRNEAPSECFVLGADCMDGHYSVLTSLTLLVTADLCARRVPTRLTGFSFNGNPSGILPFCFRLVTRSLPFYLRDPVSLQRFTDKTGCRAEQVADVAFLMCPIETAKTRLIAQWISRERERGQRVLGFNVHAHLFADDPGKRPAALAEIGRQVCVFMENNPTISCLLVPHDFRSGGDWACLEPVAEQLRHLGDRVSLIRDTLSAPELKAVCGELDAVFASRMHLAIAALGMGKPVAGFGYQGKFAGLFQHFGYPRHWLSDVAQADRLAEVLEAFAAAWPHLTRHVSERLSAVLSLAKKNLFGRGASHE